MTRGNTASLSTATLKGTLLYGIAKNELPKDFEKKLRQKIRAGKNRDAAHEIANLTGGHSRDALIFGLFQVFSAQESTAPAAEFLVEVAQAMGLDQE